MGRMGFAPAMDRAPSLLGTEVWHPINTRPTITDPVPLLGSVFRQSMLGFLGRKMATAAG